MHPQHPLQFRAFYCQTLHGIRIRICICINNNTLMERMRILEYIKIVSLIREYGLHTQVHEKNADWKPRLH